MLITAYWISPEGEHHPVTSTHINFIIDNPKLFGLTSAELEAVNDRHNAKSKTDSPTEKLIIESLQEKGWVRAQFDSKSSFWRIRYSVRIKSIKDRIYTWINKNNILDGNPHFQFKHSSYKSKYIHNREIEKFLTEKNYKMEKGCLNCIHSTWAVGVGQGFFCTNKDKFSQGGDRVIRSSSNFTRFLIPFKNYVCEFHSKGGNCDLETE